MQNLLAIVLVSILLAIPHSARAQHADLAAQDLRLARVADAMLIGNNRLCRKSMPVTGIILHSADQYGEGADRLFPYGPLAIAAIVPGSAAEVAGLEANDGITAINSQPVSRILPEPKDHLRETAFFMLADLKENDEVDLTINRSGKELDIVLRAPMGCRALVEVLTTGDFNARSDGRIMQVQYDFALRLSGDQLAVIVAHELAHSVLEHRRRKEAAGIDNATILRNIGRNQQVNLQAEIEADRLSVHLLSNAGYDPMIAPELWRSAEGVIAGGGDMPSLIYPSQSARADIVEQEISRFLRLRRGPSWPGHLLRWRDSSFVKN
ncbi:MAG: M48 family metallopeptidase [Alteraurantiacibacter sp.]